METHECKEHCACYIKLIEKKRLGAKLTNEKLTTEQRRANAKKGWEKKKGIDWSQKDMYKGLGREDLKIK